MISLGGGDAAGGGSSSSSDLRFFIGGVWDEIDVRESKQRM